MPKGALDPAREEEIKAHIEELREKGLNDNEEIARELLHEGTPASYISKLLHVAPQKLSGTGSKNPEARAEAGSKYQALATVDSETAEATKQILNERLAWGKTLKGLDIEQRALRAGFQDPLTFLNYVLNFYETWNEQIADELVLGRIVTPLITQ